MATIVVEDGTIVTGANSYVSEAELTTYATDRGITITNDTAELLIQAMDYVEAMEFIGIKLRRDQPVQWPRTYVYIDGYYADADEIPKDLKDGLCEVALAIDAGNSPNQNIDRKQQSVSVGPISVTYANTSSDYVVVQKIAHKFRKLLKYGGGQSQVVRG